MENENENLDSQIEENNIPEVQEDEDVAAIKEKYQRLSEANKQLFERAKKAEGFEKNREGRWVKPQKPETEKFEKSKAPKSDDIDFGKLSLHNFRENTVKVVNDDDIEFLRDWIKDSGKTQDEVLNLKSFQTELKSRQESRTTVNAIPSSTRRAAEPVSRLDVEYARYQQTGRMPDDPEMRIAIVNRRQESERIRNSMTQTPVVEG